jgi:formylglycine-generating enzyme required for sulfatase activity
MTYIYIAYEPVDYALASHVKATLEAAGINGWFDETRIDPSAHHTQPRIEDIIFSASAVIGVVPQTGATPNLVHETEYARSAGKTVFWVQSPSDMDAVITSLQRVAAFEQQDSIALPLPFDYNEIDQYDAENGLSRGVFVFGAVLTVVLMLLALYGILIAPSTIAPPSAFTATSNARLLILTLSAVPTEISFNPTITPPAALPTAFVTPSAVNSAIPAVAPPSPTAVPPSPEGLEWTVTAIVVALTNQAATLAPTLPTQAATETPSPTLTETQTATATLTETPTPSPTVTPSWTLTPSVTASITPTLTPSETLVSLDSQQNIALTLTSVVGALTQVAIDAQSSGAGQVIIETSTTLETSATLPEPTAVETTAAAVTPTETATPEPTETPLPTDSPTLTPTETFTLTATPTFTESPTSAPSETATSTASPTSTLTPTLTPTESIRLLPVGYDNRQWNSISRLTDANLPVVFVPAGCFLAADARGNAEETCVEDFWIGQYEITNAQYAACVASGNCTPPSSSSSRTRTSYYDNPAFADFPVINVSWEQAVSFAAWIGGRLAAETEWRYAAQGPAGYVFPWGNNEPAPSLLNYNDLLGDTARVGLFPAGASWVGAFDLAGNVWEWVVPSPTSNAAPLEGEAVIVGGSWNSFGGLVQSNYAAPKRQTESDVFTGFRVVFDTDAIPVPELNN